MIARMSLRELMLVIAVLGAAFAFVVDHNRLRDSIWQMQANQDCHTQAWRRKSLTTLLESWFECQVEISEETVVLKFPDGSVKTRLKSP